MSKNSDLLCTVFPSHNNVNSLSPFISCPTYFAVDVEVTFEYTAEQPDELTIKVGDIIRNVIQSEGGWWEGELKGKKGMFPDNFVKVRFSVNLRFSLIYLQLYQATNFWTGPNEKNLQITN